MALFFLILILKVLHLEKEKWFSLHQAMAKPPYIILFRGAAFGSPKFKSHGPRENV